MSRDKSLAPAQTARAAAIRREISELANSTVKYKIAGLKKLLDSLPASEPRPSVVLIRNKEERLASIATLEAYWKDHFEELTGEDQSRWRPLSNQQLACLLTGDLIMSIAKEKGTWWGKACVPAALLYATQTAALSRLPLSTMTLEDMQETQWLEPKPVPTDSSANEAQPRQYRDWRDEPDPTGFDENGDFAGRAATKRAVFREFLDAEDREARARDSVARAEDRKGCVIAFMGAVIGGLAGILAAVSIPGVMLRLWELL